MNTLFYENYGLRKRINITTKDGARVVMDLTGYDYYQTRTTSKKTGQELKKPVRELKQKNKLYFDSWRYVMEPWSDSDLTIYDNCRGFDPYQYLTKDNYSNNTADILAAVNEITGRNYQELKEVKKLETPAEWEALKAKEIKEVQESQIENAARAIAENIKDCVSLKCSQLYFEKIILPKIQKLENATGATEHDKKRISWELKIAGGYRENNIFSSQWRAVVKLPRNNLIRVYNLMPDSHNVLHYFEITKDGRITG